MPFLGLSEVSKWPDCTFLEFTVVKKNMFHTLMTALRSLVRKLWTRKENKRFSFWTKKNDEKNFLNRFLKNICFFLNVSQLCLRSYNRKQTYLFSKKMICLFPVVALWETFEVKMFFQKSKPEAKYEILRAPACSYGF